MLTTELEANQRQCRIAGFFTQSKPDLDPRKVQQLPVFNTCKGAGCAHWVFSRLQRVTTDEAGTQKTEPLGRCGLINPVQPFEEAVLETTETKQ